VADGLHVLENVQLWNTVAGSGQIVTNGVTTIPEYKDATHPDAPLDPSPLTAVPDGTGTTSATPAPPSA
jgi:hypothetical protein